jgi:hypothetical protein
MRGPYFACIIFSIVLCYVILDLSMVNMVSSPTDYCDANPQMLKMRNIMSIAHGAILCPFTLWLIFIVYHLRKHQRDG